MLSQHLFIAILLGAFAVSSPLEDRRGGRPVKVTSPFSVRTKHKLNLAGDARELVQRDLARAKAFRALYDSHSVDTASKQFVEADFQIPLNNAGTSFTAEVGIGTPPTNYELLVDTGSSNTVLAAHANYRPTISSTNTTRKVNIAYGSGKFEGFEFLDTLHFDGTLLQNQSIGVSTVDEGFTGFDGILGVGPTDLTENTVEGLDTVPTVTDSLATQGIIGAAVIGLSLPPSLKPVSLNGSLSFGGPDETQFIGDITYVPITSTKPSSLYWGIDQSISYGGEGTQISAPTAGIVDSGTTLVLLASDAFQAYVTATGARMDNQTGLLRIDNPDSLQSLFFNIGPITYEFIANAQMWPRGLNTDIGGDPAATYLVVSDLGTPTGQGLDFINGFTFLQRFYSVYDTPNTQVGFAMTPFTNEPSN